MLPDFQDGRTYLLFFLALLGYFVLACWPFKNLAELRTKMTVRFMDKLYDGAMSYVFDKSIAVAAAGLLMPPFVMAGIIPAYGERQRQEMIRDILKVLQPKLEPPPRPAAPSPPAPAPSQVPITTPIAPAVSPVSTPPTNGDGLCADGRSTGWDTNALAGTSLATCQYGRFVAFICAEGRPYLVTAGPARTTQVRFYSRDGLDRSSLDDTLYPRDEEEYAVSELSAETFSYFMDAKAARLTMRGRTIWIDLAGIKRAANQTLLACMA